MSKAGRILLGVALAVSFAPFFGYLLVGLLFLPMWLLMLAKAVIEGDPGALSVLGVVLQLLGGLAGAASMHQVISRVYGFPAKPRDPRWILAGVVVGLGTVLFSLANLPLAGFVVPAVILTLYLVYLDREFLLAPLYER